MCCQSDNHTYICEGVTCLHVSESHFCLKPTYVLQYVVIINEVLVDFTKVK